MIPLAAARAEVTRIDITERSPYADGRPMGERGPYERWRGSVQFAVDPLAPANANIVDLKFAPRNGQGRVEFRADLEMLVPADRSQASGAALYEVNNRGGRTALDLFNGGANDFLLRQGFVVVWSGWIAEVLPGGGRLLFEAPELFEQPDAGDDARASGKHEPREPDAPNAETGDPDRRARGPRPMRGLVRSEFVVDHPAAQASISHRETQGAYRPVADDDPVFLAPAADSTLRSRLARRLTMRLREADSRIEIPQSDWKFIVTDVESGGRKGRLPKVEIKLKGGLRAGFIYEVVYLAEGAVAQGTGLAGIRDLVSLLKYDRAEGNPLRLADGSPLAKRWIGFGTSQSGRCLRQFLYDGFNADEQGRRVLDGVIAHVAGGGLGFFNHRFASPTRTNGQHEEHLFPADYFPFAYGDSTDPFTGQSDGILRRSITAGVAPKVMHTQSSSEYWHRSGSLVHTDPAGAEDAAIPDNVRIYTFGGSQHGPGGGLPTPRAGGQLPANPTDFRPMMRALLMAMDSWLLSGREPPPSVYPKIADGSLVDWQEASSGWRAIAGVNYPRVIQQPARVDRGPLWASRRIASIEPPAVLGHYTVRVPGYGPDDRERGTLDAPAIAAPVATCTSWNLRSEKIGAPSELLHLKGGYIPLAKTKADRERAGDPRPALLERYRDFDDYRRQFMAAAEKLVAERYLLPEDLPQLEALCERHRPLFD